MQQQMKNEEINMTFIFVVLAFVVGVLVGREKFQTVESVAEKISSKVKELLDKTSK